MAVRAVVRILALALVSFACAPTAPAVSGVSPTATAIGTRSPEPSASPAPSPSASGIPRDVKRVPLEAGQMPANADEQVLFVTRKLIDGRTTRVEAIDLRTGAVTPVHETVDRAVTVPSIRDGVVTLLETGDTGEPMQMEARIFAGRWRDPRTIVQLDDFTFPIAGGDDWSPFPDPQTNGWEVSWMRTSADGTHEIRLREADGQVRAIYASTAPYSFALGRYGDVAIADIPAAGAPGPVALRLSSGGALRTLLERPLSEGYGYVEWELGRVVWPRGSFGRFTTSLDRVAPGSLTRETLTIPSGCAGYAGVAAALLTFQCGDHIELEDGTRLGPPMPLLHERAIVLVPQDVQRIATVIPATFDDPRLGPGAQF